MGTHQTYMYPPSESKIKTSSVNIHVESSRPYLYFCVLLGGRKVYSLWAKFMDKELIQFMKCGFFTFEPRSKPTPISLADPEGPIKTEFFHFIRIFQKK